MATGALDIEVLIVLGGPVLGFKVLLHHRMHVPLVALERQHILRAMLVQLLGNGLLAADRIDGDDAALEVQQFEQLRDGRHLVALAIDLALTQQEPHVGGPGADHMQWPAGIAFAAAAYAFAVNRHRAVHLAGHLGQPLLADQLQLLGIEQTEYPGKGVMRGNA